MNDVVPVVFEDGSVEYVSGTTVVRWRPFTMHNDEEHTLQSFGRVVHTGKDWDAAIRLPDGRRCQIEGWRDEALRLRRMVLK